VHCKACGEILNILNDELTCGPALSTRAVTAGLINMQVAAGWFALGCARFNVRESPMAGWKGIVGETFSAKDFDAYCHTLQWTAWRPSFIALHNTASPSLAQRPNGLTKQHIKNLEAFYRDKQRLEGRPASLRRRSPDLGVHATDRVRRALALVEQDRARHRNAGDFETEAFDSGRGLKVRKNAVAAMATLCAILGLDPNGMRLHREDPATTHACPGKNVRKLEVIQEVIELMATAP
jgi:hypothetical protein